MCLPVGVGGLFLLACLSHDYWVFATVALVGWSTGALAHRLFGVEIVSNLRQFISFLAVVLGASAVAAWLSGFLVQVNNGAFSLEWIVGVAAANLIAISFVLWASSYEVQTGMSYI